MAGYIGTVAIVVATPPIIVRIFLPKATPNRLTRFHLAASLCAFVAAVVGGVLCTKLSPEPRPRYARILAIFALLLSRLSAITDRERPHNPSAAMFYWL